MIYLTLCKNYNGLVCGPGGHIEAGETPEEAAARETREEFGIYVAELIPIALITDMPPGYCPSQVFLCTEFYGKPGCLNMEMEKARFEAIGDVLKYDLFLPFQFSLQELVKNLQAILLTQQSESSNIEIDGGPGSGRYPKGSGKNPRSGSADKSSQKLHFKHTGNTMSVTKEVKFRSGAKIPSGNKITKVVNFAGGKSGKPVKVEEHLIKQYGGSKGSWTHSRGQATVTAKNGEKSEAEIHWFEAPGVGQVNMKIKRYLEGD